MVEASDLVALISALAWPVLAGGILLVYRVPIRQFLSDLAPRVSRFSIGPVSIELATSKGMEANFIQGPLDGASSYLAGFESRAPDILAQVQDRSPVDYAVFNLGSGRRWLTSRVYLFARILERVRQLRCVVFVETQNGVKRSFVASANTEHLLYALSTAYSWLSVEMLNPGDAVGFVNLYMQSIQMTQKEPPMAPSEWVAIERVGDYSVWEHAEWLDAAKLEEKVGNILCRSSVRKAELLGRTNECQARLILGLESSFIAVVNNDNSFDRLIDREEFARNVALACLDRPTGCSALCPQEVSRRAEAKNPMPFST